MNIIGTLAGRLQGAPSVRVLFAEPQEPEILKAAARAAQENICTAVLLGRKDELAPLCQEHGIDSGCFEYEPLDDDDKNTTYAEQFKELPQCMFGDKALARRLSRPLEHGMILEALDVVDICFAGKTASTGDVITAAQTFIGIQEDIACPSSMGLFEIPTGEPGQDYDYLAFGDSAVCVNPTAEELASIAISCCNTVQELLDWEPRCALLSYSTCGSAVSELVAKVQEARDVAHKQRPDLAIDGEFQLDSALDPTTAKRKVTRESAVAGQANILIWPDINVGNVGVKLVQRFAQANAYGPLLQGFKGIVCDCSRSAMAPEIYGNIVMSCVRANSLRR